MAWSSRDPANPGWSGVPSLAGPATPSGPAETIYTPDGTTVTIGSESSGIRTVSGGGLPDDCVLFDPDEQVSIVSDSGNGRWELTIAVSVTSAHFGPHNHGNWWIAGPALIFKGSTAHDTYIEVKDCTFVDPDTQHTNNRFTICGLNMGTDDYCQGPVIYAGANKRSAVYDYRNGSLQTIETLTAVVFPVTLKLGFEANPATTPIDTDAITVINGGSDITSDRGFAIGANFAIALSGFAGVYHFGDITLKL